MENRCQNVLMGYNPYLPNILFMGHTLGNKDKLTPKDMAAELPPLMV